MRWNGACPKERKRKYENCVSPCLVRRRNFSYFVLAHALLVSSAAWIRVSLIMTVAWINFRAIDQNKREAVGRKRNSSSYLLFRYDIEKIKNWNATIAFTQRIAEPRHARLASLTNSQNNDVIISRAVIYGAIYAVVKISSADRNRGSPLSFALAVGWLIVRAYISHTHTRIVTSFSCSSIVIS